jgi:hypothetical protein
MAKKVAKKAAKKARKKAVKKSTKKAVTQAPKQVVTQAGTQQMPLASDVIALIKAQVAEGFDAANFEAQVKEKVTAFVEAKKA